MSSSHTRSTFLASVSLLLGLSACGGGGEEANLAGACFVAYAEPSLIIASVQNAVSAASVPVVSLSNITLDGMAFNSSYLPPGANVRPIGSTLECTLPCGFAVQEGALAFTVSAPGYVARSVAANGAYSSRTGNGAGCPLYLTGGNRIADALSPSP